VNAFTPPSGPVAWAAALSGLLYGVAFVVLGNVTASALLLMAGGVLSSLILVALGASIADPGCAGAVRWAVGVGVLGAFLSVVYLGYSPGFGDHGI